MAPDPKLASPVAARPPLTASEMKLIVSGLVLAVFVASLDQTILAGSLSSIASDLRDFSAASWLVSGYLIASIVSTPVCGRLSDLFGRRRLLLITGTIYICGSLFCALSSTMTVLIAMRVVQGVGAGGLRAVAMSAMSDLVSPRERGRYQAYFSTAFGVSSLGGPTLGGLLSTTLGWRSVFWVSSLIGLTAWALIYRHLRHLGASNTRAPIDWIGATLIAGFTIPLVLCVNAAHNEGWTSSLVVLNAMISSLCLAMLLWSSASAAAPMLPVRLFRRPVFARCCAVTFLSCIVMTGMTVTLPLIYASFGYSAATAGLLLVPVTSGVVLGSFISGQAVMRTGTYKFYPVAGTLIGAIACAGLSIVLRPDSLVPGLFVSGILGLAFGFQLAPLTVAIQNAVESRDAGAGMACLLFFRLLGGATGVALLIDAFIAGLPAGALGRASTASDAIEALGAVQSTCLIGAGAMLVAFAIAIGLKNETLRHKDPI